MTYLEIKKLINDNGLHCDVNLVIVYYVIASLDSVTEKVSDEMFDAICNYVYNVWSKASVGYIQLISDVVVDCVYHCFGYYQCEDITLTYEDLCELNMYRDDVMDAYCDKYFA